MSIADAMRAKLQKALDPTFLEIENESHKHHRPPGSESHFRVVIVSVAFVDQTLIARQRQVNGILADEISRVHAFSQKTYTPDEWQKRGQSSGEPSPHCRGRGQ